MYFMIKRYTNLHLLLLLLFLKKPSEHMFYYSKIEITTTHVMPSVITTKSEKMCVITQM